VYRKKLCFSRTTGTADMIADLHKIVTGEADTETQLTFLHRFKLTGGVG